MRIDNKKDEEDQAGGSGCFFSSQLLMYVKPDWTPPVCLTRTKPGLRNMRYILAPNADGKTLLLFISCMPPPGSTHHGEAHGHVADIICDWVHNNQLETFAL